ncbi:MAG: hypothetical protein DRJ26_02770 [Candidatus Methanomethylicota archaeon]|uniref:Uncharacterized protein n=1 Tax=Thermoproteota archaeon TaxID=2056631 RepID=A0A497F2J3_9CREN|nr:MAG: hypothetical protein DRJ26_02770 [Candidatus Verstraetearchaeota archaeon]
MQNLSLSYGKVAAAIFFLYLGISIWLISSGVITDILLLIAGLLVLIGVWTITYGFTMSQKDVVFWLANGAFITLISASIFAFRLTEQISISIAVLFIGVGLLIIAFMLKR